MPPAADSAGSARIGESDEGYEGRNSRQKLYSRGEELKRHLKESCLNMSVTCARCDSEVAVRLKQQHDCVRTLRSVIAHYSKIISQQ